MDVDVDGLGLDVLLPRLTAIRRGVRDRSGRRRNGCASSWPVGPSESSLPPTSTCSTTGRSTGFRLRGPGQRRTPVGRTRPASRTGRMLGPDVELRRTEYDVEAAVALMRATDDPTRRADRRADAATPTSRDEVDRGRGAPRVRGLSAVRSPPWSEIVPGIWHWSAVHPNIKIPVHSYYLPAERVLIDPIAPDDGLDWFAEHGPPTRRPADEPPPLPLERSSPSASASRCTAFARDARVPRRRAGRAVRLRRRAARRDRRARGRSDLPGRDGSSSHPDARCEALAVADGAVALGGRAVRSRSCPDRVHGRTGADEGRRPARVVSRTALGARSPTTCSRARRPVRRSRSVTRARSAALAVAAERRHAQHRSCDRRDVFASLRVPESFERQLGDRVTKRLKSLASLSGSRPL